jgi:hypothetical protein
MPVVHVQVGVSCVKLEGSMSLERRNKTITAFNTDPSVTCFLMSLKAGGVALNLTVASHVMLMDPWFVSGPFHFLAAFLSFFCWCPASLT